MNQSVTFAAPPKNPILPVSPAQLSGTQRPSPKRQGLPTLLQNMRVFYSIGMRSARKKCRNLTGLWRFAESNGCCFSRQGLREGDIVAGLSQARPVIRGAHGRAVRRVRRRQMPTSPHILRVNPPLRQQASSMPQHLGQMRQKKVSVPAEMSRVPCPSGR